MRHLTSLVDITTAEVERIFAISTDLKQKLQQGIREPVLPGRVLALLFEKPSLRTRSSFEAGIVHLGGSSLYLGVDAGWQKRESNADFAKVLSQYVDVIVARTFRHETVLELAEHSTCPIINGLSDFSHPCQALADLFTVREQLGDLKGKTIAYLGDGNNVARSLALCCGRLGVRFALAAPRGYQFDGDFLQTLTNTVSNLDLLITEDPAQAVQNADVIYTDVWTSMGQEAETAARKKIFAPFQVNEKLMSQAPSGALFMHCLPAHRGEEVTDGVLDSSVSVVIPQAGNRMHVQKGLLVWLLSEAN